MNQPKAGGLKDPKRADRRLRTFKEVDVSRLGVQVGPSTPKPGSRLKKPPKPPEPKK